MKNNNLRSGRIVPAYYELVPSTGSFGNFLKASCSKQVAKITKA